MNTMYQIIEELCTKKGIKVGTMAQSAGVSRSILTDLKMNRTRQLSVENLDKIASFFNVSVDYLTGKGRSDQAMRDSELKFALFGDNSDISDELFEDVKSYARFKLEQQKKKEQNG